MTWLINQSVDWLIDWWVAWWMDWVLNGLKLKYWCNPMNILPIKIKRSSFWCKRYRQSKAWSPCDNPKQEDQSCTCTPDSCDECPTGPLCHPFPMWQTFPDHGDKIGTHWLHIRGPVGFFCKQTIKDPQLNDQLVKRRSNQSINASW